MADRPTALLVGPIAAPTLSEIQLNCLRVSVGVAEIVRLLGYVPVCVHVQALRQIRTAGGVETPELRAEGIARSLALVDHVAALPVSGLCVLTCDDGSLSPGTALDVARWQSHHGNRRQVRMTWAEWCEVPMLGVAR